MEYAKNMPGTWEEAKKEIEGVLINISEAGKAADGDLFISAGEYGFDDLIIVPVLKNCNVVRCVTRSDLEKWGIDKKALFATVLDQIKEPYVMPMGKVLAALRGVEYDPFYDMVLPMFVITNGLPNDRIGAIGIIKARKQLDAMFPDGYTVIPSSTAEMIVLPGHVEDEFVMGMIRIVNGSECVGDDMILGTKPYYFDGKNTQAGGERHEYACNNSSANR